MAEYRGLASFSPDLECSDIEIAGIVGLAVLCALLAVLAMVFEPWRPKRAEWELYILVRKADGVPLRLLFWSRGEIEQHLDGLGTGKGTADNDHLRGGLEVKRFVAAQDLEDV